MKRSLFLLFIVLVLVLILPITVYAEDESFIVKQSDEGYEIYDSSGILQNKSSSFEQILNDGMTVRLDNIHIRENLIVDKRVTFIGNLYCSAGISVKEGGELILSSSNVYFSDDYGISVLGGSLQLLGTNITCDNGIAINSYYSASSFVEIKNSVVVSNYGQATIKLADGVCKINKSSIEAPCGIGVQNNTTLLLDEVAFDCSSYHVKTKKPISLNSESGSSSFLRIMYDELCEKGTITPVVRGTSSLKLKLIEVFDRAGAKQNLEYFDTHNNVEEECFIAIYDPFKAVFFDEGVQLCTMDFLRGEYIKTPQVNERKGYSFAGWLDGNGEYYDFSKTVNNDIILYADYKLKSVSYECVDLNETYSGDIYYLDFLSINHELLEVGNLSFTWYNSSNEVVGRTRRMGLQDVSESGEYCCEITFSYNGKASTVRTGSIKANIKKCVVKSPIIPELVYTGNPQYPLIDDSAFYEFESSSGVEAGQYEVELVLIDKNNYVFENGQDRIVIPYVICKAENKWIDEIEVNNIYCGAECDFEAFAKYGNAYFLYSDSIDGVYTSVAPCKVGTYFAKAMVDESDNYFGLYSLPVSFVILEDTLEAIYLDDCEYKSKYYAFDVFDPSSVVLVGLFNSGKKTQLSKEQFSIFYINGKYIEYGDSYVTASYLGLCVSIPIYVDKIDYEIEVKITDQEIIYDGLYHSLFAEGDLPVGKDDVPLQLEISGGGVDVGEYFVTFSFFTNSKNYNIPKPITAKLTILKKEVELFWDTENYVYDGYVKCPEAYFFDVYGSRVKVKTYGGGINAGQGHKAFAESIDNYIFANPTVLFSIEKAVFDLSECRWVVDEFVYDGSEKRVYIEGYPNGLSVAGYSNNRATDAGIYNAEVIFNYDVLNYEKPLFDKLEWKIEQACYDMESFEFVGDEFTYDGNNHYPVLRGEMPLGADGIQLVYNFSHGAKNVDSAEWDIKVSFTTSSKNYICPASISVKVVILPKEIYVEWDQTALIYNGKAQCPRATSEFTEIDVIGEQICAGKYTAEACSVDKNYRVINNIFEYVIAKAKNRWTVAPFVENGFAGGIPGYGGEAVFGIIRYYFYSDPECTEEVKDFNNSGTYYLKVIAEESENYLELESEILEFRMVAVVPINAKVTLLDREYYAFEKLGSNDFDFVLFYNNGDVVECDPKSVVVKYSNGDSLRKKDSFVTFCYEDFEIITRIQVEYATYDMSNVKWENTYREYDGTLGGAYLTGLPQGISVQDYSFKNAKNAGEYTLSASLIFDSENYLPPVLPAGTLVIKKKVISIIEKQFFEYTADRIKPSLDEGLVRVAVSEFPTDVGEYVIKIEAIDPQNYELSADHIILSIDPKLIRIRIKDTIAYLFEGPEEYGYEYIGEGLPFELAINYWEENGKIYGEAQYDNYRFEFVPGSIDNLNRLSPQSAKTVFLILLWSLILCLLVFILVNQRERIAVSLCAFRSKHNYRQRTYTTNTGIEQTTKILEVDVERAEELLSDEMARTLIRKNEERVKTQGKKRAIINIDTLGSNFEAGAEVDINSMKQKGLVPIDAGYVKILARGTLDKPLRVIASDFSLTAVKMIALTGGEAVKCQTHKS